MNSLYKILLLSIALFCCACRPTSLKNDGTYCTVTLSASTPATKSVAGSAAERSVRRLDLFAFDADGRLENSYHDTRLNDSGTLSASVIVSSGSKDFYLVANAPADLSASVTTVAELLAALSQFAQNTPDGLVMTGSALRQAIERNTSLDVQLVRLVSRFEIRSVTKAFSSPALQGLPFSIEAVFLMNAPMQAAYFTDREHAADPAASTGWGLWNRNNATATPANIPTGNALALTRYTPASPIGVTSSTNALAGHYLYAYPNPSAEAPDAGTTDYVTKLVLQVRLGDQTLYYTLGIPESGRNRVYTVENLTIKRRGTTIPGQYVSTDDVSFRVTVKDWDTGTIQSSYADGSGGNYSI